MTMRRLILFTAMSLNVVGMSACGADAKVHKEPNTAVGQQGPQHDYTSTWVFAVGEVEAPTAKDCAKAFALIESESDCIGSICKYGAQLAKDYDAVCRKASSPSQRKKAAALGATLASRATAAPSDCDKPVDDWVDRGCGREGDCEPQIRQWATRCAEEVKSPLALQLLERVLENSLSDPRHVKLDVKACAETKSRLAEAAKCGMPFDCETAMARIDEYVDRCAEGNHSGLPLEQAVHVMRIRYGANKPTDPISIAKSKTRIVGQPGLLVFADGKGAVVHVCDEPVTDLSRYLEQRKNCENGTVTVFMSVESSDGTNLEVRHLVHASDASFAAAHPEILVQGEASARRR